MAEEQTAVAEPDEQAAERSPGPITTSKEQNGDDLEYEVEFETPFGKLEFEFEPKALKKKRDERRRQRAVREAERAALAAKRKAEEQAIKAEKRRRQFPVFMAVFLGIILLASLIALAFWLFARPDDNDEEMPPELREDTSQAGVVDRIKRRVRAGIREGKRASREVQDEQRRRFEELAGR